MSATPQKNLFGLGRGKGRKKKRPGIVKRVVSAVKKRQEEQRRKEAKGRKDALAKRRLELAEAQQRRREYEKERREREQREREAERKEKARQKELLREQAYRQRMARQEQRAREAALKEQKGSYKGRPLRKGQHYYWLSERELAEASDAIRAMNPKQGRQVNGIFGRLRARRKAARQYKRELRHEAAAGRAAAKRRGYEKEARENPKAKTSVRRNAAKRPVPAKPQSKRNPEITPALAKRLLKLNVGNRPVDSKKVTAMAALMKRGIYKTTQPLVFVNNVLTDGQHRLLAIVKAGVPQRMKIQKKSLRAKNPLLTDILGGFAGGAGYAIASHVTAKKLQEKRRTKRRGGGGAVETVNNPKPKRNTPKAPARVRAMRETFNGGVNGKAEQLYTPPGTPEHVTELGRLEYLTLANGNRWSFRSNPATLGGSGGETIQRLHIGLRKPYRTPPGHEAGKAIDYGPVAELGYRAPKPHLYPGHRTANGRPRVIRFYHGLGEVNGVMPNLVLQNGRLRFKGGDYSIRREGIVN